MWSVSPTKSLWRWQSVSLSPRQVNLAYRFYRTLPPTFVPSRTLNMYQVTGCGLSRFLSFNYFGDRGCPRDRRFTSHPKTFTTSPSHYPPALTSSERKFTHRYHDLGGESSLQSKPIPTIDDNTQSEDDKDPPLQEWELRCHALFSVLSSKKFISTDELRRSIESLEPHQYEHWSYYQKWAAGMTSLLLDKKILSQEKLEKALFGSLSSSEKISSDKGHFKKGDFVRVRDYHSGVGGVEWRRPHLRTPGYIYGVHGVVERVCSGVFDDPSFLAFGLEAPKVRLYRVTFRMCDLWPESRSNHHETEGGDKDTVDVEVYEHWLEPSDAFHGHAYEDSQLFDHGDGNDCVDHHHEHDHDHTGHAHHPRPLVEKRAIEHESTAGNRNVHQQSELFRALYSAVLQSEMTTPAEIQSMSQRLQNAKTRLDGATLIARAWIDSDFARLLLHDAPSGAAELGITTSNPNAPTILTVVENTATVHNLVVCTLCSCYPSGLLGIAPAWYKSSEYRARAVREPRAVLKEFGTIIPRTKQIRVHDSTADHRYLVMPERPQGTNGWGEEELKNLITRDSMIGVTVLNRLEN